MKHGWKMTNGPLTTSDDIYKVMSFNVLKVCFIKVPFCIVEWIYTESGYFLLTLSAIPGYIFPRHCRK